MLSSIRVPASWLLPLAPVAVGSALFAAPVLSAPAGTDHTDERAAIERAVLDYAEAYYEVKPEYVERGIHRELVKAGYLLKDDGTLEIKPMDFDGFMSMVQWFVDQERVPEPGPKEVEILDALDQTALVKLTGSWGVDYMQLAKFDGRWQTRHVIWQRAPRPRSDAQTTEDHAAIERAGLDYIEAFYDVKPDLAKRSVHPGMTKLGFWREEVTDPYKATAMTYERLLSLSAEWNAKGELASDAPKKVEILDTMDHTACLKVTAEWGTDYMHLVKEDGVWRILQILWQSPVVEAGSEG